MRKVYQALPVIIPFLVSCTLNLPSSAPLPISQEGTSQSSLQHQLVGTIGSGVPKVKSQLGKSQAIAQCSVDNISLSLIIDQQALAKCIDLFNLK